MERPTKKYRKLSAFRQKGSIPGDSSILPEMIDPYLAWENAVKGGAGAAQEALGRQTGEDDQIYLIGTVGEAGTVLIEKWKHDTLCSYFPEWFVKTAVSESPLSDSGKKTEENNEGAESPHSDFQEISDENKVSQFISELFADGASDIYPVGEGGLLKTLYDLGKKTGLGFQIKAETIPVRQVAIEICEYFDLHPWELLSCGCYLVTASGNRFESEIGTSMHQIPFARIGHMTAAKQKSIIRGEDVSSINHPLPDALLKVITAETEKQNTAAEQDDTNI